MRHLWTAVLFTGILIGGCQTGSKRNDSTQSGMQNLKGTLLTLVPLTYNSKKFSSTKNEDEIRKGVSKLLSMAHSISDSGKKGELVSGDSDPSLKYLANTLETEVKSIEEALNEGHKEYARVVLKNVTQLCIQCHTRGRWGNEFKDLAQDSQILKLPSLERARLLTAFRQYDEAYKTYQEVLNNTETAKRKTFEWERAARQGLALTVRVEKDPKKSLDLVDRITNTKGVAYFLQRDAKEWKKQIYKWIKEDKSKKTKKSGLVGARKILDQIADQPGKWGHSGSYVDYLRASSLLHEFLHQSEGSAEEQAEALYLLGLSYESIQDRSFWNLNEFYYKACIYRAPKTKQALKCYAHYQESIFLGYTGSAGLGVPPSVIEYLNNLKEIAAPEGKGTVDLSW